MRATCADSTARCKDGAVYPGLFWSAVPRYVPRHQPRRVCLGGHFEGTNAAASAGLFAERWDCQCGGLDSCAGPQAVVGVHHGRGIRGRGESTAHTRLRVLRAAVAQDADAAVLLVDQARKAGNLDLLVFNVAHVAARAMLGAEGYDVAKVLRVLDSWMDEAVHGVQCPPGRTA